MPGLEVSDLERMEKELVFLKKLINLLPGNVFWMDDHGTYLGCNINLAKVLNLSSPQDIIGKTHWDVLSANSAKLAEAADAEVIRSGQAHAEEQAGASSESEATTYLTTRIPIHDEYENVIGMLGHAANITAQKQLEAALEKANLIKSDFIENMQHDLRTPAYGVCAGLADLIQSETDPVKKKKLTLINKSARRLYDLCLEVTDFDRIENHEKAIVSKKFDFEKLITSIIELNQAAADSKGLKLSFEISSDIPHVLKGDAYRIRRILMNLVGNAIKFTETGSVALSCRALQKSKNEFVLQCTVKDTGVGIAQNKQDLIYESFARGTPSNRGLHTGIGLGLRFVKQFVHDLGGDIEVESTLGVGTSFRVTLPVCIPLCDELLETQVDIDLEPEELDESNLDDSEAFNLPLPKDGMLTTLLIEDDPLARIGAQNILGLLGCRVVLAGSVKEAIKLLNDIKFDVVVSDVGLPDGTGFDIVKRIKQDEGSLNYKTPFFALSAHRGADKMEAAEQAGFITLITKPLDPKKFKFFLDRDVRKIVRPEAEEPTDVQFQGEPILDWEFPKQFGLKDEYLEELMQSFYEELPNDVTLLKEVQARNKPEELRAFLHKLEGGFSYLGVPRLQKATSTLHEAVKNNSPEQVLSPLFDQFYQETENVITALDPKNRER